MKMRFFYLLIGLFSICTPCFADDSFLADLKVLYKYKDWAGSSQTNYLRLVQDWTPDVSVCGATNFVEKPYVSNSQGMRLGIYFFQPTNMPCVVELRIAQTESILDAHEMLMRHFGLCAAKQPFPSGASIGVELGDHCYTGYPIGSTTSVTFVRNNMLICVSSGDRKTSIYGVAKTIDQQLLSILMEKKDEKAKKETPQ